MRSYLLALYCWIQGKFSGAVGYADDNPVMSPTLEGLQQMMSTCEKFATDHNLQFSTNPIPKKSKTKCLAYLKKERPLKPIKLNGNNLPWISSPDNVSHLGNTIDNSCNLVACDIMEKRARFIQRNNEINQEFHFVNPSTKFHLNKIYNMSFSGSPLWDLFSDEAVSLEKTYNKAIRIMWNIPLETHRYLIEPISNQSHLKFTLIQRFLGFKGQVERS